jgi:hypothetical protein
MAGTLGIAGVQMKAVYGQDNSDAMVIKLNIVKELFPWMLLPGCGNTAPWEQVRFGKILPVLKVNFPCMTTTLTREKFSRIWVLLSYTKKLIIDNDYSISSCALNINMIDFFDRSNRLHRYSNPGKITAEVAWVITPPTY